MSEQLKIEYKKIEEITPYIHNPRKNLKAVDIVARSIKEYGFLVPIILDKDKIIVAGHTRLKAAIKLGLKEVPTICAENLTEEQIKGFRIMDNKASEYADWDQELLRLELGELKELGFDLELTGFDKSETDMILDDIEEDDFDSEKAYENPKYTVSKGDIIELGNHKIICGDSTDIENYKKILGENLIKCVFTSPPYNMNAKMYENYKDNLQSKEYIDFNMKVVKNCKNFLTGYIFWNISYNKNSRNEFIDIMYNIHKEEGLRFLELIVWNKKTAMPINSVKMLTRQYEDILVAADKDTITREIEWYWLGSTSKNVAFNKKTSKAITNYWEISPNNSQIGINKACFPVKLPAKAILMTTQEGDIVIDPFTGSGSTLIACEQSNRKFVGIELDEKLCSVIMERFENLTGIKPIKLTN